ncbi:phage recombination protein Bet [Halopseudomonas aestusnigri]|uniref:phage recombination protein Bet n=1 Tax=Halopseudomonas aestusnigri TaxID=857252 RepID=UPI002B1CC9E1|nr:phage recombination protein Bet [Halopseudomonas aestusnigri]
MSNVAVLKQTSLSARMAERFGVDPDQMMVTLKATAFKGQVSNEQMQALLIVADQYGLNPWTKEIYAFPDRNNGIVPVVGVDGWSRIINEHQQFDGLEFDQDDESCTCIIYRKDRKHPIKVTEWMAECKRDGGGPWKSHPRRMLRHKALIQCARLAFGYTGIYDEDEAQRITEAQQERDTTPAKPEPKAVAHYPDDDFEKNLPSWVRMISEGKASADQIIAKVQSKGPLTGEQIAKLREHEQPIEGEVM